MSSSSFYLRFYNIHIQLDEEVLEEKNILKKEEEEEEEEEEKMSSEIVFRNKIF